MIIRDATKYILENVRPMKTQISLRFRSESSLSRNSEAWVLKEYASKTDQIVLMHRLI